LKKLIPKFEKKIIHISKIFMIITGVKNYIKIEKGCTLHDNEKKN